MKKMNKIKKRKFNAKTIIFTRSYDLNKKWLKKEPKIVHSVTPTFLELTKEFAKLFLADITDKEKVEMEEMENQKRHQLPLLTLNVADSICFEGENIDEVQKSV